MGDQDTGSAVYNIVAFCFDGKDTAKQTLKDAKSAGALDGYDIVAQCIVEQNEKGKVHIHEPGHGAVGAVIGGAIGGVLGLIGGPVGVLALAATGAAVGGDGGRPGLFVPKEDLEEIGEALSPDLRPWSLARTAETEQRGRRMSGDQANVVTLTVAMIWARSCPVHHGAQ